MQLKHGRLTLEVPEDWVDQSTLLFVQRRADPEPVPAPTVTPTLSVRFASGTGLTPQGLVDLETQGLERVGAGELEGSLGKGALVHVKVTLLDEPIEQLCAAFVVDGLGVVACAACGAREMKRERPRLEALIKALKL
jgi:hypothetical protein